MVQAPSSSHPLRPSERADGAKRPSEPGAGPLCGWSLSPAGLDSLRGCRGLEATAARPLCPPEGAKRRWGLLPEAPPRRAAPAVAKERREEARRPCLGLPSLEGAPSSAGARSTYLGILRGVPVRRLEIHGLPGEEDTVLMSFTAEREKSLPST